MAQNITLLGASYSDVPAVQLPKTGGGTARFDDCTVVTAGASDVASGKVFVASDGTVTTGTAPGGDVYEIFSVNAGWKEAAGRNDYAMSTQDYAGPHFSSYASLGQNGIVFSRACTLDITFGTRTCHDTRRAQTFEFKRIRNGVTTTIATATDNVGPVVHLSKFAVEAGDVLYGSEYNAYAMRTARYFVAYIINP